MLRGSGDPGPRGVRSAGGVRAPGRASPRRVCREPPVTSVLPARAAPMGEGTRKVVTARGNFRVPSPLSASLPGGAPANRPSGDQRFRSGQIPVTPPAMTRRGKQLRAANTLLLRCCANSRRGTVPRIVALALIARTLHLRRVRPTIPGPSCCLPCKGWGDRPTFGRVAGLGLVLVWVAGVAAVLVLLPAVQGVG